MLVPKFSISRDSGDCKSFTVEDTTEAYDSLNNIEGYGSPNMDIADVTAATITLTEQNATTSSVVDVFPTLPNLTGDVFSIYNTDLGLLSTQNIPDSIWHVEYAVTGNYSITAVNQGSKTFSIAGDRTGILSVGQNFTIANSTGNDGVYTVVSITYTTETVITVSEVIPDATADGDFDITHCYDEHVLFGCAIECCLIQKLQAIEPENCDCLSGDLLLYTKIDALYKSAQFAASCGKINKASALLTLVTKLCNLKHCSTCNS